MSGGSGGGEGQWEGSCVVLGERDRVWEGAGRAALGVKGGRREVPGFGGLARWEVALDCTRENG